MLLAGVCLIACDTPPTGFGDRFDDPGGFGLACDGAGSVATEAAGIWHMRLDFGSDELFSGAMRIDRDGDEYRGVLFGAPATEVRATATFVFSRREWITSAGVSRAYALVACTDRSDGKAELRGQFASCRDGECRLAELLLVRVDALDEPVSSGLELLGELGGWQRGVTLNVRQRDGVAYLARGYDGLRLIDVSEPSAPREVGHAAVQAPEQEFYNDVKLIQSGVGLAEKRYAVMASSTRGAVVVDVTDATSPVEAATFPALPLGASRLEVHSLFIEGTRAYLANLSSASLDIYDLSDPTRPVLLGGYTYPPVYNFGGLLHDLYVSEGRAYLCYWNHGLVIVDTAEDPANPTLLGVYDDEASDYSRPTSHSVWATQMGDRSIAIHGDEDFGAHVRVIDVDPASVDFLNVLGRYQTRPEVSVHNLMVAGGLGLVTYYQDGLRLLDLSNPSDPVEIGHFRSWDLNHPAAANYGYSFFDGAIGVDLDLTDGLIYLADTQRGLLVLRQVAD